MHVHVPQPRDEVPASAVDALDALAEEQIVGRRHGGDPAALNNHGAPIGHGARRRIHDGDVLDRGARVEFARRWAAGNGERRRCYNEADTQSHEGPLLVAGVAAADPTHPVQPGTRRCAMAQLAS